MKKGLIFYPKEDFFSVLSNSEMKGEKKMGNTHDEVPVEQLRWRCDPETLGFSITEELSLSETIIGQERALEAMQLGLDIEGLGYNIFVAGPAGTGRMTTVKYLLSKLEKGGKVPNDECYVNNFKDPDTPHLISLPPGKGKAFKTEMEELITSLKRNIPLVFESDEYQRKGREILERSKEKERSIIKELENKLSKENLALVQLQVGPYVKPDIFPVVMDKPVPWDQLEKNTEEGKFPKEQFERLREKYSELSGEVSKAFQESKKIAKEVRKELTDLEREAILPSINELIGEVKEKYGNEKIDTYLDEVTDDILENINRFKEGAESEAPSIPGLTLPSPEDTFREYQVNVIIDNSEAKGAPVVFEASPTYRNIFGMVERNIGRMGVLQTDFMQIKAGSFLRANGGYLVLEGREALLEPGVWLALKRSLKNKKMEIQNYDPYFLFGASALKPEPIDINVKVILVGDDFLYRILYNFDDDFKKIFKIKGDFDSVIPKNGEAVNQYAGFIKRICDDEGLAPFDKTGVAAVVEFGVRQAGRKKKISTKFSEIADVIREAHYWAEQEKSKYITEAHVDKAIEKGIDRVNLIEDKLQEMIEEGTIMIDTEGMVTGQVNGLSVYQLGDYTFGKPSRITTSISMGKAGIINIEREADLSGPTHNKGVLILSGYLREKYAQDKPLTLSASICFEQSYSGVEGDSASSTEVYALLSSLSGLPLRQDIAVTGSVNQKGEIQPIGGVNHKIEGFFDVCQAKGLTGSQGVMIPHQNLDDLMLRKDVVKGVEENKFHVYPVKTVDQGIEILTGVKAGERKEDGTYAEKTVNFLVDKKLGDLADRMKEFDSGDKENKKS
jgi:lon-related putative ATP-dependent protease